MAKKQAIQAILHTKDEAFDLFRRNLQIDVANINDDVARKQFENLLEQYKINKKTKTVNMSNGLKRTIVDDASPNYNYDKFINDIGKNSGYENLSRQKGDVLSTVELSSNESFVKGYKTQNAEWIRKRNRLNEWKKEKKANFGLSQGAKESDEEFATRINREAKEREVANDIERNMGTSRKIEDYDNYLEQEHTDRLNVSDSYKEYQNRLDDELEEMNTVKVHDDVPVKPEEPVSREIPERVHEGRTGSQRIKDLHVKRLNQVQEDAKRIYLKGKTFEESSKKAKKAYLNYIEKETTNVNEMFNRETIYKETRDVLNTTTNEKTAKKVLNDATGKDGVGLWRKALTAVKNHPVISTGIGIGTVWGISELAEDDSL